MFIYVCYYYNINLLSCAIGLFFFIHGIASTTKLTSFMLNLGVQVFYLINICEFQVVIKYN